MLHEVKDEIEESLVQKSQEEVQKTQTNIYKHEK